MAFKTRRDQDAEDARTIARVRGALEGYQASGGESVSIRHVLDLINPRGLWSHDPERRTAAAAKPSAAPDDRDPMTGCRPASASGN